MDEAFIAALLGSQDIYRTALSDGMSRAREYFSAHDYSETAAEAWVDQLLESAPHLFAEADDEAKPTSDAKPTWEHYHMTEEQFSNLPPAERMTRDRALRPPVVKARRVQPTPPADLVEQWNKLAPIPRRTAHLEWLAQQQGKP